MTTGKEMIRHSINLLEYQLWFQDEKLASASEDGFIWKDIEGYIYRCGYKTPVKTDVIFLLYLLLHKLVDYWSCQFKDLVLIRGEHHLAATFNRPLKIAASVDVVPFTLNHYRDHWLMRHTFYKPPLTIG